MKKTILMFFCAVTFFVGVAQAAPINGLFNTGVDDSGLVLPVGTLEQHYNMTGALSPANVISKHSTWVTPPTGSLWIGPSNGNFSDPVGDYSYILTFDLTGLVPTTAFISGKWSTDNTGVILLNDIDTGITQDSFMSLNNFNISDGFVPEINTLEFIVTNRPGSSTNPTGLLVANLTGQASPVPVPAAIWLLGSGLVGIAGFRKLPRKSIES
ncbi:hypothetical protein K8R14_01520 [bacterium]|nr:hypothetical protein [bacterium]